MNEYISNCNTGFGERNTKLNRFVYLRYTHIQYKCKCAPMTKILYTQNNFLQNILMIFEIWYAQQVMCRW